MAAARQCQRQCGNSSGRTAVMAAVRQQGVGIGQRRSRPAAIARQRQWWWQCGGSGQLDSFLAAARCHQRQHHSCWRGYEGIKTGRYQTSCEGLVRCGRGGPAYTYTGNQTKWTSNNQNGELRCMEPRDLLGSEAARENPRCSVGESVYLLSHF